MKELSEKEECIHLLEKSVNLTDLAFINYCLEEVFTRTTTPPLMSLYRLCVTQLQKKALEGEFFTAVFLEKPIEQLIRNISIGYYYEDQSFKVVDFFEQCLDFQPSIDLETQAIIGNAIASFQSNNHSIKSHILLKRIVIMGKGKNTIIDRLSDFLEKN